MRRAKSFVNRHLLCTALEHAVFRASDGSCSIIALDSESEMIRIHNSYDELARNIDAQLHKEAMEVESKHLPPGDALNLEKHITILETPFGQVCRLLGLDCAEPTRSLEVADCIFLFDPQNQYVLSSVVVLGGQLGFFGIQIGANWLDTAGKLESQGFKQAEDLERFTKPGADFCISVYLYPDNSPDVSLSKVRDYSVCARYGSSL